MRMADGYTDAVQGLTAYGIIFEVPKMHGDWKEWRGKGYWVAALFAILLSCGLVAPVAQESPAALHKVMTLPGYAGSSGLDADRGSGGLWLRLLKLSTTASAIHTTAHPDDENGGTLTYLSRGLGARTALLTLNRGESGANAVGPELFDGLGLIRTEELLLSDQYYGLDDQYFSTVVDYGYSKNLEEALEKWGKENVLRDVVRVIRINRPLVIISRFHGSKRDGHGNHETSGVVSQEVFEMAADPNAFPEQISQEGLRPWQALKMYRGGFRPEEDWTIEVNSGEFSPWLGKSYRQFASQGLALQRSQTSGRLRDIVGHYRQRYQRLYSKVEAPERETSFFDGIDTSIKGIFSIVGGHPPKEAFLQLAEIEKSVEQAIDAYSLSNPSATVPSLLRGLSSTRQAIHTVADFPDAVFMLRIKERQFEDAVNCALGIEFRAMAVPDGTEVDDSPWSSPPTMGMVVPGQRFQVRATLGSGGNLSVQPDEMGLSAASGWSVRGGAGAAPSTLEPGVPVSKAFSVQVASGAAYDSRYFYRDSLQESVYRMRDAEHQHMPGRAAALTAYARYLVDGVPVEVREVVRSLEANLPFGHLKRQLKVAPAIAVNLKPEMRVVPLSSRNQEIQLAVELIHNRDQETSGSLSLEVPQGWQSSPASHSFRLAQPGQRTNLIFSVRISHLQAQDYQIRAKASALGQQFWQGYQTIRHRDLETNYIYRDAVTTVRGVDVEIAPNLKVGYLMGVGDQVPSGIEQLGASVTLLDRAELASGDLSRFDAIVLGTRAYAVRQDLITFNQRLLDYAEQGGNLIVLYNTQEFKPERWAPYTASLPRRAEEVSEEDSPVKILAPDHPLFQSPNKITQADFDNWVEQRGSKFFSHWDSAYTALIETQDRNQEPQKGGWVTAKHGQGHYTYFAYAFHRQSPYGVPGAFRIFANLLSLGQ